MRVAGERQQGHEPGPFDGVGDHSLFKGCCAGPAASLNFSIQGKHALECFRIFIVHIHLAKAADLGNTCFGTREGLETWFTCLSHDKGFLHLRSRAAALPLRLASHEAT